MRSFTPSALAVLAALTLSACGSGTNSQDDGTGGGEPPPPVETSCQGAFDPDKLLDPEQDCTPIAGKYCPTIHYSGEPPPEGQTIPCNGVVVDDVAITAAGYTTHYLAIRRASGSPSSVYLQLHYLSAPVRVNANQMRLNELVVARNALVLVPQAPALTSSLLPPGTIELPTGELFNPFLPDVPLFVGATTSFARWPNSVLEQPMLAAIEGLLDAVVADGRSKFGGSGKPLYVAGYSNGGVMGLLYACDRPGSVSAVLATAANFEKATADSCPGLGVVLVHGTNDLLQPYIGSPPFRYGTLEAYSVLKSINGCGADRTATIQDDEDDIPIEFVYADDCANGKRIYAVTSDGGGHTWPSQDDDTAGLDFNTFGPIPRAWDATIYGYDLLRLAGGE